VVGDETQITPEHGTRGGASSRWRPMSAAATAGIGARLPSPDISPVREPGGNRGQILRVGWGFRDKVLRRGLSVCDVLAAYLALLLVTNVILPGHVSMAISDALIAPFIVLTAKAIGLYDRDQHVLRKTTIDEIPKLIHLSVLYALGAWLAEGALVHGQLTKAQVFTLALGSFLLLTAGRVAARAAVAASVAPERCLIVGDGHAAARIVSKLRSSGVNAEVVGAFALPEAEEAGRAEAAAAVQQLQGLLASLEVERVIIAPSDRDQDGTLHAIRMIKALGVKVSVLPRLLEVVGSSSTFDDVDGMTLLGVRQYGMSKSSGLLKRTMDIAGASAGLIVLAPLLAMLAIAIKLDSPGPVFFRQRRCGRRGERFQMIKFRSMVVGADRIKDELRDRNEVQGGLFKISDDPRITRVGRLLRRTSLDELPQLLNVLGGSMSLVGPRPLVEDEDALIEGWQRRRLVVRPGMTGMWQIFGSSRIPMQEMVKIDYLYGANWSIWLDLKILLSTVPYVLRRRGL
jgi:exopolysaccharide biosynthesis polyprenyl glycosylphosphotransferase